MKFKQWIVLALGLVLMTQCKTKQFSPADYVNPMIGTGGHGHTFPGATVPFGMVQLSPDTRKDSWDGCSGYHYSDKTIMGFSHTHLSGTGVGDYGDIRLMPTIGDLKLIPGDENDTQSGYRSSFSHTNEQAEAGFYKVFLDDYAVSVELTASERVGFHRYTFPQSEQAHIIVDLLESITSDEIIDSQITFVNDTLITGYRQTKGWARNQYVYFAAVFSKPFVSYGINTGKQSFEGVSNMRAKDLVGWVGYTFENQESILIKVGISAVDVQGATNNIYAEIPHWNFDQVRKEAKDKWNNALKKVEVESKSKTEKTVFYTALYHTMIAPNIYNDADGRFRGHDMRIHQAENDTRYTVFSLWDTFRTLHPLFTIIEREKTAAMVRTMLDIYDKGGLLPVWELAANETWCMIGYHAVPVIADAYTNGIRNFDHAKALEAMKKSAMQDHHGLQYYKSNGYIPADKESESVSKTLEYAYDDWCIAKFAQQLGDDSTYNMYIKRSQYYKNLYDQSTRFFRGKQNGGFITPFDPTQVNFMLTEANTWQYNFFVLQDVNGHIDLMGGFDPYETMLDTLFRTNAAMSGRKQSDITGLIGQYAHGNEPSHHIAYLYNFVGKPYKTQEIVRQIMDNLYTDQPDGLSGNEDCGQMSAWYVMSAMGFYPVTPASGKYIIGLPRFPKMIIHLENGKVFRISTKNFNNSNKYVQSVKLNGKPYSASWLNHETILEGGEIVFIMGPNPGETYGKEIADRPTQRIEDNLITITPTIHAGSKTFAVTNQITIDHPDQQASIYYTLNDSEPDTSSLKYNSPITINSNAVIKTFAVQNGKASKTVSANFFKIPADRVLYLESKYNAQYPAGGDQALLDRQHGNTDFRTGSWQGYHGIDLIAVVDLGKIIPVKSIETGFLQDINSWIFLPIWVEYYISTDGTNYELAGRVINPLSEKSEGGQIRNFSKEVNKKQARFVKIVAKNKAICPDWHIGKGEPAWIFADEIVIN